MMAGSAALKALLAQDAVTRAAAATPEPQLPTPRRDGEFADLPPIQYVG
jgi:hypothetical protein